MGFTRLVLCSLLVCLVLLQSHGREAQANQMEGNAVSVNGYTDKKLDCGVACAARCQLSSRPRLCKRACGTCCARCKCVPPGTSGNYDVCPCYASLTTHRNRRKCP
ncbi:OLC1v1003421C1 [Oldenlandia corymbosa var. corymbosa]|uniref:OLC1v1003421C1 n=1 Tax=Oldenlandia corymbosa var. corymbosa TaxID=529605 RepID=A0AAV1DDE3_OLDCO|nr:OLC1v1003421C1 [Oldenlandia corymbosa var. corymbosa]